MEPLTISQILGAVVLGLGSLYICGLNWFIVVRQRGDRSISRIPLIGGVLGAGAMLLEPNGSLAQWAWLPFILDAGSVPGLLLVVWHLLRRGGLGACGETQRGLECVAGRRGRGAEPPLYRDTTRFCDKELGAQRRARGRDGFHHRLLVPCATNFFRSQGTRWAPARPQGRRTRHGFPGAGEGL